MRYYIRPSLSEYLKKFEYNMRPFAFRLAMDYSNSRTAARLVGEYYFNCELPAINPWGYRSRADIRELMLW
jgi:hypothetical protein